MREGVIKDIERQRDKKAMNLLELQNQQAMEKKLKEQRHQQDLQQRNSQS